MATADLTQSARRHSLRSSISGYALIFPAFLLVLTVIIYPALVSVIETLTTRLDGTKAAFTIDQYQHFFTDTVSMKNLGYTVTVTLLVIGLLYLICFPIALYLRFSHSRLTNVIHILSLFPLFVPGIILAFAMIRFTITHGLLDTLLSKFGFTHYTQPYLTTTGSVIGLVW